MLSFRSPISSPFPLNPDKLQGLKSSQIQPQTPGKTCRVRPRCYLGPAPSHSCKGLRGASNCRQVPEEGTCLLSPGPDPPFLWLIAVICPFMLEGDITEIFPSAHSRLRGTCRGDRSSPRADATTLGLLKGFIWVLSSDRDWDNHVMSLS